MTTISPTLTPTQYPTTPPPTTRTPTIYDPAVGTAFAPTTPGGTCLNAQDYGIWTAKDSSSLPTGFDKFVNDITICSTSCASALASTAGNTEYDCGGFARPSCPSDLYQICVGDCLSKRGPKAQVNGVTQTSQYSADCVACMGELANCGATVCGTQCIAGSKDAAGCKACNEVNCNLPFSICSGLNIDMPQTQIVDLGPILGGTIGGAAVLLTLALLLGCVLYRRNKKNKAMSPEDLARLAGAQSMTVMPIGNRPMTSNPEFQQQHSPKMQQQQPQRIAPSVRMTSMASQAQQTPNMFKSTVPLVAIYDFVGERGDELNVSVGTKMFGIEQQDGWWLAKTEDGIVGLIPVSYTEMDAEMPSPGVNQGGKYINPDF